MQFLQGTRFSEFGSLLAVGIFAHIAIQVIVNIAVVTNVFPNTGVTLPFISYGGTASLDRKSTRLNSSHT